MIFNDIWLGHLIQKGYCEFSRNLVGIAHILKNKNILVSNKVN